jgi:hypothetical protein
VLRRYDDRLFGATANVCRNKVAVALGRSRSTLPSGASPNKRNCPFRGLPTTRPIRQKTGFIRACIGVRNRHELLKVCGGVGSQLASLGAGGAGRKPTRRDFIETSAVAGALTVGAPVLSAAQSRSPIVMPTPRAKAPMSLFGLRYPIFEAPHGRATSPGAG